MLYSDHNVQISFFTDTSATLRYLNTLPTIFTYITSDLTIIMANPAPSFNCDKCFKKFTAKHNLDIHSRTVNKKLERCSLCHRVVKNLVQHHTRYHADVSEGRIQCQYCFRWYIRICTHKCSRLSQGSSNVPMTCAPLRITEDPQPSQSSPSTVSTSMYTTKL